MNKQAGEQYMLQKGDNPAILDRRFGFNPGTVASLNPGLDFRRLRVGQMLNMPKGWSSGKPTAVVQKTMRAAQPQYHTISRGDTMRGLDKRYGLPLGSFERANPGLDYSRLPLGARVNIPSQVRSQRPIQKQPVLGNVGQVPAVNRQTAAEGFVGPSDDNAYWAMMHESTNGKALEGDVRNGYPHARGVLQIREVFPSERAAYERSRAGKTKTYSRNIDDVNDYFGTNFTLKDRDDPVKSLQMYKMYLTRWGKYFHKKRGRNPTDEEYWRMWNGGPEWYKNKKVLKSTDDYVRKVNDVRRNHIKRGLKPGILWNPKTNKHDIDIRTLK